MDEALAELLNRKQAIGPAAAAVDWDDRRDRYLAAVDTLYRLVTDALMEAVAAGTVAAHRRSKQLTETYIGSYAVDDLLLVIGGEQVRFSPRGRNIVGAAGRVDVIGDGGEATLIVQPGGRWGYVQAREPTLRVVPFDGSSLAEVLTAVMRHD